MPHSQHTRPRVTVSTLFMAALPCAIFSAQNDALQSASFEGNGTQLKGLTVTGHPLFAEGLKARFPVML